MRRRLIAFLLILTLVLGCASMTGCGKEGADSSDVVVLRISNWEEYIDLGEWDEEEDLIDLEDGTEILGVNAMYEDFEEWYYDTYGIEVRIEYSTFGTNEELYNQMTIGDVYDLACPSEYMIMKMMREDMLVPYSENFRDVEDENNYYERGLSPYIRSVYDTLNIDGQTLSEYASGYMWGTYGIVYNPELVDEEDASSWNILLSDKYNKQITIKDSVRECLFSALAMVYYDDITDEEFVSSDDYQERLSDYLNRTDKESVDAVEEMLSRVKDNVYSFETDAGKADMVTGKVLANAQWSGDAVYTMDQADEDGIELCYAAPDEGTNLWFDGWVMLKKGISQDLRKQHAAEAFVNYVSMPENAIRNMYYIGYTSVISGGDSNLIFQYIDWCYGAEEEDEEEAEESEEDTEDVADDAEDAAEASDDAADSDVDDSDSVDAEDAGDAGDDADSVDAEEAEDEEEELVEYKIGYFFDMDDPDADDEYCIITTIDQTKRQLYAQYPPKAVVDRSVVMRCFDNEGNDRVNRMWTNVRCFDLMSLFR
ncbi:MAG: extracellular solute-binding protein [Lachnospiraceae bacterium]|nr:extracellular solute-binding protein [Candidatus Merdinaster equi]